VSYIEATDEIRTKLNNDPKRKERHILVGESVMSGHHKSGAREKGTRLGSTFTGGGNTNDTRPERPAEDDGVDGKNPALNIAW